MVCFYRFWVLNARWMWISIVVCCSILIVVCHKDNWLLRMIFFIICFRKQRWLLAFNFKRNSIFAREEAFQFDLQQWHWAQCFIFLIFYICLSVCHFVKWQRMPKIRRKKCVLSSFFSLLFHVCTNCGDINNNNNNNNNNNEL